MIKFFPNGNQTHISQTHLEINTYNMTFIQCLH